MPRNVKSTSNKKDMDNFSMDQSSADRDIQQQQQQHDSMSGSNKNARKQMDQLMNSGLKNDMTLNMDKAQQKRAGGANKAKWNEEC